MSDDDVAPEQLKQGRLPEGAAIGIIVGPLTAVHADRIVVGGRTVHLRPSMRCDYPVGTDLKVTYWERDGWLEANSIALMLTFR